MDGKTKEVDGIRASRTWQMLKRHGILRAVKRNRESEASGDTALFEIGLQGYAFAAVVVPHPELFTPETVQHPQSRVEEWIRT